MDIAKLISELKKEFKLNDKAVDNLTKFYVFLNESYEKELFNYSIKKCLDDCCCHELFSEMSYLAGGYFRNLNIPYFCIFELISTYSKEIFRKEFRKE